MESSLAKSDPKQNLRVYRTEELDRYMAASEDLKKLKVVVLSIAGRFRQGKSFLLNFIIKYLRAGGSPDWLESNDSLVGFDWRNSRKRITQGVLLWPEIFKMKGPNGDEVAVLLMDTQGVFDPETTVKECTDIFSFSVLLSSIQIFNIKTNIQGDDLSQLELFTKYGQIVAESKDKGSSSGRGPHAAPFQDLVFLVRDWAYAEDVPYGWEGGYTVLDEELNKPGLTGELLSMRQNIKKSFESARCYLMPHPGRSVATSNKFKGNVADIDPEFVQHLRNFVTSLLAPENLAPKRLNGQEVTLGDFFIHIETYVDTLSGNTLPTPRTLYEATVSATNNALFQRCSDHYHDQMAKQLNNDEPLEVDEFEKSHRQLSDSALQMYETSAKMGEPEQQAKLHEELRLKIQAMSVQFRIVNDAAQVKKRLNTEMEQLRQRQLELEEVVKEKGEITEEMKRNLDRIRQENERLIRERDALGKKQAWAIHTAKASGNIFQKIGQALGGAVRKLFLR